MSYLITREIQLDAGHRVPNHKSKCRNVHGHRYRIQAVVEAQETVSTKGSSDEDMVADFGDLKRLMTELIHDPLDHGFIVWREDRLYGWLCNASKEIEKVEAWKVIEFPYIPTAESIAKWCFQELEPKVMALGLENESQAQLVQVNVWETPNSVASFRPNFDSSLEPMLDLGESENLPVRSQGGITSSNQGAASFTYNIK